MAKSLEPVMATAVGPFCNMATDASLFAICNEYGNYAEYRNGNEYDKGDICDLTALASLFAIHDEYCNGNSCD